MTASRLQGLTRGCLAALIALAATSAIAAEPGKAGMPQFDPTGFAPQLVWLAIAFITLYLVMAKVALPRVSDVLQMRADRIKGDLDRAAALKNETDTIIAAYEKALADARNQAATVSRDTAASLAKISAERQGKVNADLTARIKSAEANIAAARTKAMTDIQSTAAEIAAEAVRRLGGMSITAGDAAAEVAAAAKGRS